MSTAAATRHGANNDLDELEFLNRCDSLEAQEHLLSDSGGDETWLMASAPRQLPKALDQHEGSMQLSGLPVSGTRSSRKGGVTRLYGKQHDNGDHSATLQSATKGSAISLRQNPSAIRLAPSSDTKPPADVSPQNGSLVVVPPTHSPASSSLTGPPPRTSSARGASPPMVQSRSPSLGATPQPRRQLFHRHTTDMQGEGGATPTPPRRSSMHRSASAGDATPPPRPHGNSATSTTKRLHQTSHTARGEASTSTTLKRTLSSSSSAQTAGKQPAGDVVVLSLKALVRPSKAQGTPQHEGSTLHRANRISASKPPPGAPSPRDRATTAITPHPGPTKAAESQLRRTGSSSGERKAAATATQQSRRSPSVGDTPLHAAFVGRRLSTSPLPQRAGTHRTPTSVEGQTPSSTTRRPSMSASSKKKVLSDDEGDARSSSAHATLLTRANSDVGFPPSTALATRCVSPPPPVLTSAPAGGTEELPRHDTTTNVAPNDVAVEFSLLPDDDDDDLGNDKSPLVRSAAHSHGVDVQLTLFPLAVPSPTKPSPHAHEDDVDQEAVSQTTAADDTNVPILPLVPFELEQVEKDEGTLFASTAPKRPAATVAEATPAAANTTIDTTTVAPLSTTPPAAHRPSLHHVPTRPLSTLEGNSAASLDATTAVSQGHIATTSTTSHVASTTQRDSKQSTSKGCCVLM